MADILRNTRSSMLHILDIGVWASIYKIILMPLVLWGDKYG
ncbi:hypothetical protein KP509_06G025400 [Ceratopteris richardii]|uniref:Uncharacterized protein n=1 Tax=Ceratopteris richardii TaxID=49495 RepID=A0A8T2UEC1_CERRI|nr:hypothetical protein KP509_06G025400 [Ceratopteris richardii]